MSMKLPVRVGAIGCGAALEQLYLHPLRRLEKLGWIEVVGLAEPNPARQAWAKSSFPRARVGATVAEAFSGSGVQLTVISSPPPMHAEHAAAAFQCGSHVLCEKPLAGMSRAGARMMEQARAVAQLLSVGMTRRYYPCLGEARRWLAEGRLGKLKGYSYREGGVYAWPVTSSAPFRRETSGGGVLLDKGVHILDLLTWLFGAAELLESADDALVGGVEGNAFLRLQHGDCRGTMQVSWDQDLTNTFIIQGDRGELMMPIGPLVDLFERKPGQPWQRVAVRVTFPRDLSQPAQKAGAPGTYYECFEYQLIQMLRAIVLGEAVPVTGEEGLAVLELIEAAYERARPLVQPWLSAAEQSAVKQHHWNASRTPVPTA